MRHRWLLALAPSGAFLALVGLSAWSGCSSSSSDAPAGDVGTDDAGGDTFLGTGLCVADKTALDLTYCPGPKSFVDLVGACGLECVLAANRHEETPTCVQD